MKNSKINGSKSIGGKLKIFGIAALVLVLAVLTVLSMRGDFSWVSANGVPVNRTDQDTHGPKQRPLVTVNDKGETVVRDQLTGKDRELSQDESQRLADGLRQILKDSHDGLVEVARQDGSVSIDLKGHFHNAMVVREEADGTLTHSCINDLRSAAAFFDIDPQLLGVKGPVTKFTPEKAEER